MKIVINRCFGGFGLSDACEKALGLGDDYDCDDIRTDERLIALVEKDSAFASYEYAKLVVVEIPDNATDYEINEYDGLESVIAVVDGKIVHL